MRIELPDINVLLAMTDPEHRHHEAASQWFAETSLHGWATCPLTQNGFVRVLSAPAYPGLDLNPGETIALLEALLQNHAATHHFWPDSVSLADRTLFRPATIQGHRQVPDIYLLGLYHRNEGTLVTLDAAITVEALVTPHPDLIRRL